MPLLLVRVVWVMLEIRRRAHVHLRVRAARKLRPIRRRVRLREPPQILLLRIPPLPLRRLLALLLLAKLPQLLLLLPVQLERIHLCLLRVLLLLLTEGDSDWADRRVRAALWL